MRKYLTVVKTTFNDSIQYATSILFRIGGFTITMLILISLWNFIYSGGDNLINGYSLKEMIWYLLLAEIITFGSGSKVSTNEVKNTIKSGNIAYQVTKPYSYPIFIIFKFLADTFIRFVIFLGVATILGLIFAGPLDNFSLKTLLMAIPIFFLAVLITGMVRILISLSAFWVEDSTPFQNVYNKLILIFGVFFPMEMFPNIIQKIVRFSPIYGVSYGPAKLVISSSFSLFKEVLISQIIIIIIISILMSIVYRKGVKKLNVNGG